MTKTEVLPTKSMDYLISIAINMTEPTQTRTLSCAFFSGRTEQQSWFEQRGDTHQAADQLQQFDANASRGLKIWQRPKLAHFDLPMPR